VARITLENISFRYPGAPEDTLTGLHIDIADGEAHALLGASGAGKTTLLNLLSGLLVPSTGKLLFDGEDVSRLTGRDRNVAQVFRLVLQKTWRFHSSREGPAQPRYRLVSTISVMNLVSPIYAVVRPKHYRYLKNNSWLSAKLWSGKTCH
jgi:glycerol transport system ATP-binding protein